MSILAALLAVSTGRPMVLSVSDSTPEGSGSGFSTCSPGNITSNSTTVSVEGGVAPYSYSWALSGGAADGGPFSATAPSSASTAFQDQRCETHIDNTEVWRCTVTDDIGAQVSIDVTVTLTWADLS